MKYSVYLIKRINKCLNNMEQLVENHYEYFDDFFVMTCEYQQLFGEIIGYCSTLKHLYNCKYNNYEKKLLLRYNIAERLQNVQNKYRSIFDETSENTKFKNATLNIVVS